MAIDHMSDDEFRQLTSDIARVVQDYHASVGHTDTPTSEILEEVRAELERVDVATLVAAGVVDTETAVSYTRVLSADPEVLTSPAVTSHADGILEGSIASWYGDNAEGGDLEDWVDEELERVMSAESADADAACAAACAAAVAAEREARANGDTGAVAVVVVEDVDAPCDEDGGF
jgi:hypothetical protein